MSLTFIDTNKLPKKATAGQGEFTEVLNEALCNAHNVLGSLRWLKSAETFKPDVSDKHQLIYLMDGKGRIQLNNKGLRRREGRRRLSRPVRDRHHPGGERRVAEAFSSYRAENSEVKTAQPKTW